MRKYIVILLLFISNTAIKAQTADRTVGDITIKWQNITAWDPRGLVTATQGHPGGDIAAGVRLYWEQAPCGPDGKLPTLYGGAKNIDPGITIHDVWITAAGITCDGKTGTALFVFGDLAPYQFVGGKNTGQYHFLASITRVIRVTFNYTVADLHYSVEYDADKGINKISINGKEYNEWLRDEQQKAQENKQKIQNVQQQFNAKKNTYTQKLNSIRDAGVRNKYTVALNNTITQFNTKHQLLLKNYTTEDAGKIDQQLADLSKLQQSLDASFSELDNDIVKQTQQQKIAKNTQIQAYQQQANNYNNAANNSNGDAIQQAMYNNLAQINAVAAGNTAMAEQLKQQQQQASQANMNAIVNTLTDMVNDYTAKEQERADIAAQREEW
ncbi:MAG: hypothetical protein JSS96_16870, partial [Bacteroidetes bacterium]|nr:hypothetical protein [Bacteroidota bacterium]